MSQLRPKLPARLHGKKFDLENEEVVDDLQMEFGDELLRVAAIAAVLSMVDEVGGPDPSQIGRQSGSSWAQDHRRLASGRSSVLQHRQGRSAWK